MNDTFRVLSVILLQFHAFFVKQSVIDPVMLHQ